MIRIPLKVIHNPDPVEVTQTSEKPNLSIARGFTLTPQTVEGVHTDPLLRESFLKDYNKKQREACGKPRRKALSNLIKFKPKAQKAASRIESAIQNANGIAGNEKNQTDDKSNSLYYWTSREQKGLGCTEKELHQNPVQLNPEPKLIVPQISNARVPFVPTEANRAYAKSLNVNFDEQYKSYKEKYAGRQTEASLNDWFDKDHAYRLKKQNQPQTAPAYQKSELKSTVPFFEPYKMREKSEEEKLVSYAIQKNAMDEIKRKLKGASYEQDK